MGSGAAEVERYCISCRHSLRGICSDRCPECGRGFDPRDPRTVLPTSSRINVASIEKVWRPCAVLVAAVGALCFVYALIGGDPLVLWALAALVSPLLLPLVIFVVVFAVVPAMRLRRAERVRALLAVVLLVSVVWSYWPMRITFFLCCKSEFEEIVRQVQSGQTPALPQRVGMFEVRSVEQHWGNTGVQVSGGAAGGTHVVKRAPGSPRVWVNTNWEVYLGDGWYYVYED